MNKIKDIDKGIAEKNDSLITQALHFGGKNPSINRQKIYVGTKIQLLISSGRFDEL